MTIAKKTVSASSHRGDSASEGFILTARPIPLCLRALDLADFWKYC